MCRAALYNELERERKDPGRSTRLTYSFFRFVALFGVLGCIRTLPSMAQQFTATVGNEIASPIFVNLYWDATWDKDNPSIPKSALDSFMTAILSSSYFHDLSEYGIQSGSYGGGFVPAAACTQTAPNSVGYYDPINASIMGFLECEIQHGSVPTGPNVVYNLILPAS
jgi:hypothetical protein